MEPCGALGTHCGAALGLLQLLHVDALLAYLDERMCVPRDMGGPAAAALRALHRRRNGRTVAQPSVVRVNRF